MTPNKHNDSLEVGLTFATHLLLAWNILERDKQFRSALASGDIIGQAEGMLMERFGIDAVAAFELLTPFPVSLVSWACRATCCRKPARI